ncbi:MAG: nucleotidyltransferase domain-containing protein [Lentimicrobium sp.]|nr:nucleotidyltransferase domain-containing protein [Lentimicrobium sp.]
MDSKLGLLKGDLETITTIIRSIPGINKVVVFGSRAKGAQRPGSDIDLAVWSISTDHVMTLSGKLNDETLLPYTFDVISYDDISNEALKAHINRVGVVIYP